MTDTTTTAAFTAEGFNAFLQSRCQPDWLVDLRRDAWQTFQTLAYPDRRQEQWRRTDIRMFQLGKYHLPLGIDESVPLPEAALAEGIDLAGRSISLDGRSVLSQLDADLAKQGVRFGSLEGALDQDPDWIRPYIEHPLHNPSADKFAALHAACWTGGHLLYVPRGVTVERPLHTLSAMTDGGSDLGRVLVVLEDDTEATLLTETLSPGEEAGGLHCGWLDVRMGRGSRLRLVSLQDWGKSVWHFGRQRVVMQADTTLQWTLAALGSRLAMVNQDVLMDGPGGRCQVNGVLFTEGRQHQAYHTLQHHRAPQCRSDFLYKAALQDQSQTVWRGMVKVDPAAQQTDGYQRNDSLMLSDQARADSIPGLEIEADDVACSHGSTTGRVDEELIFYAQCRGFTRREAILTVVTGFFQQIFDRITIESVRDVLGRTIAERVRDYRP